VHSSAWEGGEAKHVSCMVLWTHKTPCCGNLMGGELGVSLYGGRELFYSPWNLHPSQLLHLLPTLFHSPPSALISLLGIHEWAEYSLMGLVFGGG
jgi:hypothetical protein